MKGCVLCKMLNEYKKLCKDSIVQIPDWEKMSKNDLCFAYIENEHNENLKNQYFCAILYKYWNAIAKYYAKSQNVCDPEDIYELLVDAITYALEKRRWEDKDSTIYGDSKGPDKVINRFLQCRRDTLFQQHNRKKRRDSYATVSLDAIKDDFNDSTDVFEDDLQTLDFENFGINDFIKQTFLAKDYFAAYMLDFIAYGDVVSNHQQDECGNFNYGRLVRNLQSINESYVIQFQKRFNVRQDVAINSLRYIVNLDQQEIRKKIEYNLGRLYHNKKCKELLGK